ncbi:MAG TPA: alpha/beta hydrolase [Streptosporangiaceae bacterium]|nr:alpha/beta hydrolase [Streptosporangiaceae bacterium]
MLSPGFGVRPSRASYSWRRRRVGPSGCSSAAGATPGGLPAEFVDRMYRDFDRATRRSVLRLYRSLPDPAGWSAAMSATLATAPPAGLTSGRPAGPPAAPGEGDLPVLVIWGAHDPYLRVEQAEIQRRTFPHAEVVVLPDSGHWPFADDPDAVGAAVGGFWEQVITRDRSVQ